MVFMGFHGFWTSRNRCGEGRACQEDDDDMQKESAVSKKLSEMTTRRVTWRRHQDFFEHS